MIVIDQQNNAGFDVAADPAGRPGSGSEYLSSAPS